MTLNQSALLELTEMLRTADGGDVMRQMLGFMLQALVDAEATVGDRRRPARAHRGAYHAPQRHPRQDGLHDRG